MSREVIWTKSRFDLVCDQGMLGESDREILEAHIKRKTNLEIAMERHCDISVINATINRLKQIYDAVQREFPDVLDERNKAVFHKKKRSN